MKTHTRAAGESCGDDQIFFGAVVPMHNLGGSAAMREGVHVADVKAAVKAIREA